MHLFRLDNWILDPKKVGLESWRVEILITIIYAAEGVKCLIPR